MPLIHGQNIGAEEIERLMSSWDAVRFARLSNAVAWASTWREAQTLPAFTERVIVADNGIDAEWQGELAAGEGSFLRAGVNVFQYKKREVATQQRGTIVAALCRELRGAALDVERRTGKTLSSYVLFTNVDLTTAQHDELRTAILEGVTGDRVHVGVVGAADLAAMLNDLSHLRSAFFATEAFRTWGESWDAHQHVSAFAQTALIGREDVLATLQTWIDDSAVRVIALSGTHMMGKSRVALEATRQRDTAFVEALDRQTLNMDHLRRLTSPGRVVLALVNDPDAELAEELARETLATDGLKLIFSLSTADAVPVPSFGRDTRVRALSLSPLSNEKSGELLKAAGSELDFSLESWVVENAGGVPGVILAAAQVGAELRRDGGTFLDQVARGFEQKAQQRLSSSEQQALRALSLMSHVGIEGPVRAEGEIIGEQFGVDLNTLLDSVERLHAAGLIRLDGSYAEVVPPPLANRLAGRMIPGRLSAVRACLSRLSEPGRRRFLRRLVLLQGEEAQRFWNELLGDTGPFTTLDGIVQDPDLFRFAAAANGARVGPILRRLLKQASVEQRRAIAGEKRRDLFYACEEMLFRDASSAHRLCCLALRAETENETWGNNSSGVFKEAFHPLHPQMPLPLDRRLEILRELLTPAQADALGRLAVDAAAGVLESGSSVMMRQSGSAAPLGQMPQLTWPEVWQYQTDCIDLLVAATYHNRSSIREQAGAEITRALTNFVAYGHIEHGMPHLRHIVDRVVAGDLIFNASQLADRLAWSRYALRDDAHGGAENNAVAIGEITELLQRLNSSDFSTRMRLQVGGWSLDIENEEAPTAAGERAIAALAGEACADPRLLTNEIIAWLCGGAEQAGRFWHELGRQDEDRRFETLARDLATRDDGAHGFMLYVVGWCERNPEEARAFFEQVAGDGGTSPRAILFGALEIDPPDIGAERIVQLIRENRIDPNRAVGRLEGRWLREASEAPLVRVLELVAGPELENSGQIPALLDMRLHGRSVDAGALADFAWRCLEAHPTLDRHMGDYYSGHLGGRLAPLNPGSGFRAARAMYG